MQIKLNVKSQGSSCCAPSPEPAASCCEPTVETNKETPFQLNSDYPVAILGAGPVGLAAAAHLAIAGESFIVLEKGVDIAENIKSWQHVRLFSPWQYNVDKAAKQLLLKSGWTMPEEDVLPTGQEIREAYLQPLANVPEIKPFISFNTTVVGISKKNHDKMKSASRDSAPFVLYTEQNGETKRILASAVIDATGTWATPNPVHADNVWTSAEQKLADNIFYGIPNVESLKERYTGKHVAVIGGGHSAINTILELEKLEDVEITWILRKKRVEDAYGGEDKDALAARGELGSRIHTLVDEGRVNVFTPFYIEELAQTPDGIIIKGEFLMATGYEQVRVELDLPETGVCSLDLSSPSTQSTCC